MMDDLGGSSRVFFDPNSLSKDGLISLNTYSFSKDGEYFAYGLSNAGSDWVTIQVNSSYCYWVVLLFCSLLGFYFWTQVRNVSTGEDLEDKLERVKFTRIKWTVDGKGFFYGVCNLQFMSNKLYKSIDHRSLYSATQTRRAVMMARKQM